MGPQPGIESGLCQGEAQLAVASLRSKRVSPPIVDQVPVSESVELHVRYRPLSHVRLHVLQESARLSAIPCIYNAMVYASLGIPNWGGKGGNGLKKEPEALTENGRVILRLFL